MMKDKLTVAISVAFLESMGEKNPPNNTQPLVRVNALLFYALGAKLEIVAEQILRCFAKNPEYPVSEDVLETEELISPKNYSYKCFFETQAVRMECWTFGEKTKVNGVLLFVFLTTINTIIIINRTHPNSLHSSCLLIIF